MSYGTPADVAQLARVWTNNGEWVDPATNVRGTNPSLSTVQDWLDRVSNQMNIALASQHFVVPINQTTSPITYSAVTQYVVSLVADMAHVANNVEREVTPEGKVMKDMAAWVETNADGFALDAVMIEEGTAPKNQISFRVVGGYS